MKKRRLTDKQYYEQIDRLYKKVDAEGIQRKEYCQYHSEEGRYCTATTQKSCKRCKMFTPTTQMKIRLVAEHIVKLEDSIRGLHIENNKKEGEIQSIKNDMKMMENYCNNNIRPYASIGKSVLRHRKKVAKCGL